MSWSRALFEGKICMLMVSMTMKDIFCDIESIKQTVFEKVQLELNQFGFVVCNANVYQKMQQ